MQEGLTNIVKHANASAIHLQLIDSKTVAQLTLEDDGLGFGSPSSAT
ncbi:MAG: hypothetical protein WBA76_16825 [Phormidesmis sp.]